MRTDRIGLQWLIGSQDSIGFGRELAKTLSQDRSSYNISVTNFIQLVSPQLVDQFSQTKLCWKAPNKGYLHIWGMYKSDNKQLRYQAIVNIKALLANILWTARQICMIEIVLESAHQIVSNDILYIIWRSVFIEIQVYQYNDIISYLLK